MGETVQLVTGKTDKEFAEDLRMRFVQASEPMLTLMDEAKAHSIELQFTFGPDYAGKMRVQGLSLYRIL